MSCDIFLYQYFEYDWLSFASFLFQIQCTVADQCLWNNFLKILITVVSRSVYWTTCTLPLVLVMRGSSTLILINLPLVPLTWDTLNSPDISNHVLPRTRHGSRDWDAMLKAVLSEFKTKNRMIQSYKPVSKWDVGLPVR